MITQFFLVAVLAFHIGAVGMHILQSRFQLAALATVVGVLVEVPVMLSVVAIVNRTRGWYQPAPQPAR